MSSLSSPEPDDLAGRVTAMKAELAAMQQEFARGPEADATRDEQVEWMLAQAQMRRAFMERHRATIAAAGYDLSRFESPREAELFENLVVAQEVVCRGEEVILHLGADLAEAERALAIETLGLLRDLEALSPEEWEKHDVVERAEMWELLMKLRGLRPDLLAELPIELRREWEGRLGI